MDKSEHLSSSMEIRPMTASDRDAVAAMIMGLYSEDPTGKEMTDEKIRRTFDELIKHSERGTIWVMEKDSKVVGYAITINYWSNEYGGNILFLDELYVNPSERGSGIGSRFLRSLVHDELSGYHALILEVLPTNVEAIRFYERNGFVRSRYEHLVRLI